ncbi:MAG: hypothetical protein IJX81_05665 [Clostridia bacterium]|nr:hypothetical protein [Clostridia bacterium]
MEDEKWKKKLNEAILKVAKGCSVAEVVEEYVEVDGEMKLTKQKKTKKEIPPDLKALQLLLGDEKNERPLAELSDEELEAEKTRLLHLLSKKQEAAAPQKRPKPRKRVVRKS